MSPLKRFAVGVAGLALIGLTPAVAYAGKPGGGGGGSTTSGTTLKLVMVDPADTVLNNGDKITFVVNTTATTQPFVAVNCKIGGTLVYSASHGFFPSYPWAPVFTMSSDFWKSG